MSSDDLQLADKCITCKNQVRDEEPALQCDLCEGWEHIHCVKMCDRPSQACYAALVETPCKSLLFTCSRCRRKGTLARRLMHAELTLDSAQVQKGLYEQLLADKSQEAERLRLENETMLLEKKCVEDRLNNLRSQLEEAQRELCILRVATPSGKSAAGTSSAEATPLSTALLASTPCPSAWSLPPTSSVRRKLPRTPVSTVTHHSLAAPLLEHFPHASEGMPSLSRIESAGSVAVPSKEIVTEYPSMVTTQTTLPSVAVTVPPATPASTGALSRMLPPSAMRSSMASTMVPASSSGVHWPVVSMPLAVPAVTQAPALPIGSLSTVSSNTATSLFKQPPAFKELRERISKFSGESKEDFEVWLADYCEATGDCGWTDELRARWFSWFLSGAAKHTWQRTLSKEDKAQWESIVKSYKGHYGVHMDPRTAYLRCHELQYHDFTSVQGLLEAMKDYQRMAPDQLSNDNLISILWNKVPFKLQKEVGEIKDWPLQEVLHRLLRAEARVAERERRSNPPVQRKRWPVAEDKVRDSGTRQNTGRTMSSDNKDKAAVAKAGAELELKNVKCFGCHQKGHVISDCPEKKLKKPSRVIQADQASATTSPGPKDAADTRDADPWEQSPQVDTTAESVKQSEELKESWMRVLTADTGEEPEDSQSAKLVGPTFKVEVDVEGVKTRALLDNGSQVSLVRGELLAKLRAHNKWTLEQCHNKNRPMDAQPIGASGQGLGATSVVILQTRLDCIGQVVMIPCFVVMSDKPIWQGALRDCAVVLGTNAMIKLGIQTVLSDGSVVTPTGDTPASCAVDSAARGVFLVRAGFVAPRQSRMVEVSISPGEQNNLEVGVLTPTDNLANQLCDFHEALWTGTTNAVISLNNWGSEPITLFKGQQIGYIEPAGIVPEDDPVWTDSSVQVLVCQDMNDPARLRQLQEHLQFGDQLVTTEREQLSQMLARQADVFALSDEELGETELVTHEIDTGNARPVRAMSRRLPYAVKKELEEELKRLLDIGCIEPSNSSYASP